MGAAPFITILLLQRGGLYLEGVVVGNRGIEEGRVNLVGKGVCV